MFALILVFMIILTNVSRHDLAQCFGVAYVSNIDRVVQYE